MVPRHHALGTRALPGSLASIQMMLRAPWARGGFMKLFFAVLAFALAPAAVVIAQAYPAGIAVDRGGPRRPMPEEALPEGERLAFLAAYIVGDASLLERRQALNRAIRLAAGRDHDTLQAWRERETEFYRREAARIEASALPRPARPCDDRPEAGSTMPASANATSTTRRVIATRFWRRLPVLQATATGK